MIKKWEEEIDHAEKWCKGKRVETDRINKTVKPWEIDIWRKYCLHHDVNSIREKLMIKNMAIFLEQELLHISISVSVTYIIFFAN